jgi:hypothetical protein
MDARDELLRLLIRGLRDKASLTARDWARIRELEEGMRCAAR